VANGRGSGVEAAQDLLAKAEDQEDPWLISYADLVTNLLAFMVLLVSMAGISFESIEAIPGVFASDKEPAPLKTLSAEIMKLAEEEGLKGRVATDVDAEGLAIQLEDRILFPSGVASLTSEGGALVDKLARLFSKMEDRYRVRVEGHTDDVPISTAKFRDNWDLSAGRALEVRGRLASAGVDESRLSIVAYADQRPAKVPQGLSIDEVRARNRRVVIRVFY
jgi:chemotaxis protein MotB